MGVFDGPGGADLRNALILAAYLVGLGYAVVLWVAYRLHQRRKVAEARLRRVYAAFESGIQGALIADGAGAILEVNGAFERLTGYRRAEALGRGMHFLASQRHDPAFLERVLETVAERDYWEGEMWHARKGGELHPVHMTVSAVRDDDGRIASYAASFVDITERRIAEQRIRHLALHDILTDLPNRSLMREGAQAAIARAQRDRRKVALLFVDLDRFKNVNDSLGHPAGDQLLRQCATRLLGALRAADLVGRQGGDEFAVLLPDLVNAEDAARIAAKLLDSVRQPFAVGTRELRITCSIGISLYPEGGADFDTLLRNADAAMYAAKSGGRDCYRFHSGDMTRRASERLELEADLRRALESGGLALAYQPQMDLRSGALAGVEALVRWQHAARGAVSPAQFIPVAEESGLILPVGEWVLREACGQKKAWREEGVPVARMSVNLSSRQLNDPTLVATVNRILEETALQPADLELEITEGMIEDADQAQKILHGLSAMGVTLAIDDFGMGYSSLAHLKRFPIDTLKIDRTFVRDVTTDQGDAAIAKAIIAMAHSLKLKVIAEGVETKEQLAFLEDESCDEFQGFLYSQAIPGGDLAQLLRQVPGPMN